MTAEARVRCEAGRELARLRAARERAAETLRLLRAELARIEARRRG